MFTTDLTNNQGTALIASGTNTAETGNLYWDKFYDDNTVYTYDVSNYLKSLVENPLSNNYGLLLIPPSPANSTEFTRIVVGNRNLLPENKNTTKLEIYYLTIQPQ